MKKYIILSLTCIGVILFIYRYWFLYPQIIGGDWPYYYKDYLRGFLLFPVLWAPWLGGGLGSVQQLLGLHFFGSIVIVPFTQWLNIPWNIVYKVGWFGLFLVLSFFSPVVLWRSLFSRAFSWWPAFLAGLIYSTNTYILMVTGGGQMGVALAYAVAPLVLAGFIKRNVFWFALALGFQMMIDPRIAYITMIAIMGFWVFRFSFIRYFLAVLQGSTLRKFGAHIGIPLLIAILLNAFWILPMIVMRNNPLESLGVEYTSIDSIKFFSFADFSHALSLLHPNWPENIFGKTYFLQPEFLVLPILAFLSLLYWQKDKKIFFFAFLGLVGIFLAKGANPPFGGVYRWLFTNVPGFAMFRDPTKFYVLIALSYSTLIPLTLKQLTELTIKRKAILVTLFLFLWLFTIRQAALGNLGGTFGRHAVPEEYRELERFLQAQPSFSRTLWVPRQSRFSYGTLTHMPVEAEPLFGATTAAELKVKLDDPTSRELLEDLGIGFVMIPYDSLGELFLTDRKYDEKKRQEYETVLDGVGWLTKIRFGNLAVYKTFRHRDLFWVSTNEPLSYRRIRPDRYAVSFTAGDPGTVYFSQNYHQGWVFVDGNTRIKSRQSPHELNSFQVLTPGTYDGMVVFEPQKYVTWGMAISLLTVLGVVVAFML